MSNAVIREELKRIAVANGGHLRAPDVVEAARDKKSVLHSQFEWDDTAAAEKFRISQARGLIRVVVEYLGPAESSQAERVFVSLSSDREDGRGYRQTISVMSDEHLKKQLLEDARTDMIRFQKKYAHIQELAEVISIMKRATKGAKHSSAA